MWPHARSPWHLASLTIQRRAPRPKPLNRARVLFRAVLGSELDVVSGPTRPTRSRSILTVQGAALSAVRRTPRVSRKTTPWGPRAYVTSVAYAGSANDFRNRAEFYSGACRSAKPPYAARSLLIRMRPRNTRRRSFFQAPGDTAFHYACLLERSRLEPSVSREVFPRENTAPVLGKFRVEVGWHPPENEFAFSSGRARRATSKFRCRENADESSGPAYPMNLEFRVTNVRTTMSGGEGTRG